MKNKFTWVNYQPIIGVVGYDDDVELAWLNSALTWRPSGLEVAGRERSSVNRSFLQSLTIPCVEIWNLGGGADTLQKFDPIRVGFDHFEAGAQMGRYLASRYKGHFGYVGVRDKHVKLGADRLAEFESALADSGVSAPRKMSKDNSLMATTFLNDKSLFYAGFCGTEQILTANPDLRVLYYLDDNMAVGGMMLCLQKGLKIPGDIAIAGFGGMDIGAILPTRLTTTVAFRLRIGKTAAEVLLKQISGSPVSVLNDFDSELIRGETA
jgi:LacI family gluconate utilization system Gnt-I transcriptional repressor